MFSAALASFARYKRVSIAFQEADGAAARLVEGILRRKSFYFQQRTGKLDMRAIGRVDVDKVVKDVDIDTLQVSATNPVPCAEVGSKSKIRTCGLSFEQRFYRSEKTLAGFLHGGMKCRASCFFSEYE